MKTKFTYALLLFSFIGLMNCTKQENIKTSAASEFYEGIEFEMKHIPEPNIPNNTVNIKDYGAVSGGQVLNTQAFADAIEAVTEMGGGKVIIPTGIWLTGPITLKSKLELHAQSGAVIKFSTNKDLYPVIETSFEGLNTWRCLSPINGKNLEDVAFTGKGVWDGSGDAWRFVKKQKLTASQWKKLVASGGVVNEEKMFWYPSENYMNADNNAELNVRKDLTTQEEFEEIRDFLRPVMVSIQNSKRVMLDGPTFQNSPAWNIHPLMVEDLIVRNITVRNPHYSQNGDGIDVESCKNVLIENSSFDVGDDAICIKAGKDKDGRDRNVPCENLIIRNNIVYHGHGGVTVGSEMSSGVRNMHVSNCTFMGTDVGLRFKSKRGRGGVVENIYISNIWMTDIPSYAISFNLFYGGLSISEMLDKGKSDSKEEEFLVNIETPEFKNISMKNIVIDGAHQAVYMQGLPEMNIKNIEISNLIARSEKGISVIDTDGLKLSNIKIDITDDVALTLYNSKNIKVETIDFQNGNDEIQIFGNKSENIEFNKADFSDAETQINRGKEVSTEAVIIK